MGFRPRVPYITVLERLGLTTNLRLCLDAGDANSYNGGASWLDTSGNGYDFFRGTTSGADATDPTFNGVAGGLSVNEFFSTDGGDLFRYDSTSEAWMDNLHKNNALFTILAWQFLAVGSTQGAVCGNNGDQIGSATGILFRVDPANARIGISVGASNGFGVITKDSANGFYPGLGSWRLVGVSYDEAAGAGTWFCDLATEAFTGTYTNPTSGAATHAFEIMTRGNAVRPMSSGGRMAAFMAWEGVALTAAQVAAVYNATHSFIHPRRPRRTFTQRF